LTIGQSSRYLLYIFLKLIFGILTKFLFSTKVVGLQHIPEKPPYIIVANHSSFGDVAVIAVSLPAMIKWIARKDVYDKWYMKPFHKALGTIVVNGSTHKALKALREKEIIGIFPEGSRSHDGKLKKGDVGVAVLALKSGCPVIPIGITGLHEAFGWNDRFPKFHKVVLRIGRPIFFPKTDKDIIEENLLRASTDQIMAGIADLIEKG